MNETTDEPEIDEDTWELDADVVEGLAAEESELATMEGEELPEPVEVRPTGERDEK